VGTELYVVRVGDDENVSDQQAQLASVNVPSAGGQSGFIDKFRPRLLAERERRLAEERTRSPDELAPLNRALGFESTAQPLTGPWADKVAAILASPKGEQFKRVIDDYYQLALVAGSVERGEAGRD
jgi:hypothetical protein